MESTPLRTAGAYRCRDCYELGGQGAVDDAVVGREREPHPVMHGHLVTDNYHGLA
jgi:hypothetical protein